MPITAYKNGKKQIFSDLGWKLLGNNKQGWVEKAPVVIDNTAKKPDMGPSNPLTEAKTVITDNTVNKSESNNEEITDTSKTDVTTNENTSGDDKTDDQKNAEFMKAVEGLSRSSIKDYFDQQNPPVKYNKKATDADLQLQLAKHLNFDIVELQKAAL